MADFQTRSEQHGIASASDIKDALSKESTFVVDVRSEAEIESSGKVNHPNWQQTPGTPTDCPAFSMNPEELVPDKSATILIYCGSGRRAAAAKKVLVSKGYNESSILNGGGYADLKELKIID